MKKRTIIWALLALSVGAFAQPQASYYTASTLDGKNGRALEVALQNIIYTHTKISYGDLWVAYETTDLAPTDSIPNTYTGDCTMLVYDMYAWMRWFPKFYEENDHTQTGGINREHCVPNSWFGGERGNHIAYTDLHHLFPSDGAANNAKQNYPLGDSISGVTRSFPTSTGTYKGKTYVTRQNACSHVWSVPEALRSNFGGATKVFEPADMYKGDFARAYFYVVCAYEKKLRWQTSENTMFVGDSTTYTTIQPWALSMLLDWHRNDPVSEKEKVRNNAVESLQHNRNPFVDYPELVEFIWGNRTSESFSLANATCSYNSVYYEIHASNEMVGGSVVASPASALAGQAVTLYATPDETHLFENLATNWSVMDGETPVSVTVGEGNSCTFTMPAGNVTVSATFQNNPRANHYLLREDFSSITAGNNTSINGSSSQWTRNDNFSAGNHVYQAGGAIKIGKTDEAGSITTKAMDLSENGGRFMLSFDVKGWTTVEGDITVTVTGQEPKTFTYTSTMDGEFQTIQHVFEGGTAGATITFATTAKRAFLDNIKVYYFLGMQEIEISSVGWATYYTDMDFVMPTGVSGYTVSYNAGALSLTEAYPAGTSVPAETPMLVHGEQGVYPYSVASPSEKVVQVFLYGHLHSGTIAAVEGATRYYKLLKPADGPLGWYWGEASGGRFPLGDHKAYLALPVGAGAPACFLIEESATNLEELTEWQNEPDWNRPVYNILGQRVAKGYVGIVLQDGVKYLAR